MIKLKNLLTEDNGQGKYLGDRGYMKNFKLWRALIFNKNPDPYMMFAMNHSTIGDIIHSSTIEPLQKKIDKLKFISPSAPMETGAVTDYEIYNGGLYFLYDWLYFAYNAVKIKKTFGTIAYEYQPPEQPFWDWLSAIHDIDMVYKVQNQYRFDKSIEKQALDLFTKYYDEYIIWYKKNNPGKPIPKRPFTQSQFQAANANGWGNDVQGFYQANFLPKTYQRPPQLQHSIIINSDLGSINLR